jgi:3-oxoacyl-[acyl-carrier protein] reductase
MELDLKDRVALVTGASKGIGRAIALALAREGAKLCLVSRDEANLAAARDEIERATGARCRTIAGDVGDPALAARAVREAAVDGRLDILVNNAGGPPAGGFSEHDDAAWSAAFDRSLMAPVRFTRAAAPLMKARRWGRIISVTSILAREPSPGMVLSATLRAGVSAFAKAVSTELAPYGITVNTILPSAVLTERLEALTRDAAARQGRSYEDVLGAAMKTIPAGRLSSPAEVADLAVFLCSARAAYMTGLNLGIDGGAGKGVF